MLKSKIRKIKIIIHFLNFKLTDTKNKILINKFNKFSRKMQIN